MKRYYLRQFPSVLLLMVFFSHHPLPAQDTFSITAIDSLTGEVGSAGASCVGSSLTYPHGAKILSDVIPGIGVIHTQAAWHPVNQQNAHNWMLLGLPPEQIIDSLIAHDATNNPSTRQYGIVDYNGGHPRSAGYTGSNCLNYKNHKSVFNYSVQGNILLGQQILDSMENRFLNTQGTLADRLMAALQGAKVVGADTRCAARNSSSQSSFLRVGRINDPPDSLYLDIWMAYPQNYAGVFPADPIDSLQILYDIWKTTVGDRDPEPRPANRVIVYTGSSGEWIFDFRSCVDYMGSALQIFDLNGRLENSYSITERRLTVSRSLSVPPQMYFYRLIHPKGGLIASGKFQG